MISRLGTDAEVSNVTLGEGVFGRFSKPSEHWSAVLKFGAPVVNEAAREGFDQQQAQLRITRLVAADAEHTAGCNALDISDPRALGCLLVRGRGRREVRDFGQ